MFQKIYNDGVQKIAEMSELNSKVNSLASRYFDSAENAEKFIYNYQELKLNTEIPLKTRQSMHESVINTINIARDKRESYS